MLLQPSAALKTSAKLAPSEAVPGFVVVTVRHIVCLLPGGQDGSDSAAFAAWEVLRAGNPAVLCGSPLVAQLLERWTLPYLASGLPPCMQADYSQSVLTSHRPAHGVSHCMITWFVYSNCMLEMIPKHLIHTSRPKQRLESQLKG